MIGLALVVRDHGQEFEYDLMTGTGRTLSEYMAMGAAGRAALVAFVKHSGPGTALRRAIGGAEAEEAARWGTAAKTNAILADIYDAYAQTHMRKGRKAKPYPRPGASDKSRLGKDAIKVRDFEAWWSAA